MDLEFDWEAAVAEIDRACAHANGAAHVTLPPRHDAQPLPRVPSSAHGRPPSFGTASDTTGKARQKTLSSFFGASAKKPADSEGLDAHPGVDCGDGGVEINPVEAATWVYPANMPQRDYQFSIAKTALFTNTLVSLPTGLGKTLIAAVVMYNYFRWFTAGKIVFAAPSRPLVMQQIEACHNIVGIPQEWSIDMTGQMTPSQRATYWQSKRVFFVTPQVLERDLQSEICPMKQIVCLVLDEAHRAMGNYSYCVVVRELMTSQVRLRILALTATPGSKQVTIQTVIDNLQISCLEYRDENDPDVKQYTHARELELIQVVMDPESSKVKDLFLQVMQPVVYRLCGFGVFYSKDVPRLTPFEFVTARDKFRQAPPPPLPQGQYAEVEGLFGIAITLYHIYKLLFSHGMRPAFEMLHQKLQQGYFASMMGKNDIMRKIRNLMHENVRHGAPSPKLVKLEEILVEHFRRHEVGKTRVIIFTNFRESVKDIMESIKRNSYVKAMEFIGQSSGKCSKGQTQKMQQAVLQKFRAGGFNTIVATSIAEEGLDIMEVDLVVCFDANISPIRMIQRMGRTGRKRDGRVVVLASEGAESQGYLKKQAKNKALSKHMHNGGINSFDFHLSPRMVPHAFQPTLQLVHMAIEDFVPRGRKPKQEVATSSDPGEASLTVEEANLLEKYYHDGESNWKPSLIAFPKCQLIPTSVFHVKHSFRTTSMLIQSMQSLQGCLGTDKVQEFLLEDNNRGFTKKDENLPVNDSSEALLNDVQPSGTLDCPENEIAPCGSPNTIAQSREMELRKVPVFNTSKVPEKILSGVNVFPEEKSRLSDKWHTSTQSASDGIDRENEVKVDEHNQEAALVASPAYYENQPEQLGKSLHECFFSNGLIEVNENGYVSIASPPHILEFPCLFNDANQLQEHHRLSTPLVSINKQNEQGISHSISLVKLISPTAKDMADDSKAYASPLSPSMLVEFVSTTPHINAGAFSSCSKPLRTVVCTPSSNSAAFNCCTSGLAEVNVVPLSPMAKTSLYERIQGSCEEKVTASNHVNGRDELQSMPTLSLEFEKLVEVTPVNYSTCRRESGTAVLPCATYSNSPLPGSETLNFQLQNSSQVTTPQQETVKCDTEDWKLNNSEAASLERLPRLKQLHKVHELAASWSISGKGEMAEVPTKELEGKQVICKQNATAAENFFDEGAGFFLEDSFVDEDKYENKFENELDGLIDDKPGPDGENEATRIRHLNGVDQFQLRPNVSSKFVLDTPINYQKSSGRNGMTIWTPATSSNPPPVGIERVSSQFQNGLQTVTPQHEAVKCTNEDWKLSSSEAASIKKPRFLKRLRKVQKQAVPSSTSSKDQMADASIKNHKNKREVAHSRMGRYQRKAALKTFFDEEAEVSSDEELSADEDDDSDEDESELDGFIDDNPMPAQATQCVDESPVDMMAIYRRSLLTQTPSEAVLAPWLSSSTSMLSGSDVQTTVSSCDFTPLTMKSEEGKLNLGLASRWHSLKSYRSIAAGIVHQGSHPKEATCENQGSSKNVHLKELEILEKNSNTIKLEVRKRKLDFCDSFPAEQPPVWDVALTAQVAVNATHGMNDPLISRGSSSKMFDLANAFEEDIFEGLDLDALEAAAAEQCRSNQTQVNPVSCWPNE